MRGRQKERTGDEGGMELVKKQRRDGMRPGEGENKKDSKNDIKREKREIREDVSILY